MSAGCSGPGGLEVLSSSARRRLLKFCKKNLEPHVTHGPWGTECTVREAKGFRGPAGRQDAHQVWKLMRTTSSSGPPSESALRSLSAPRGHSHGSWGRWQGLPLSLPCAAPLMAASLLRGRSLAPGADGERCNHAGWWSWCWGGPCGEVLQASSWEVWGLIISVFLLGRKGLLCDRAALLVSCGIFPLLWVCSSQAGVSDSSAVRRQWQRPQPEIWYVRTHDLTANCQGGEGWPADCRRTVLRGVRQTVLGLQKLSRSSSFPLWRKSFFLILGRRKFCGASN